VPAEDSPQLTDYIGKLTHPECEEDMSMSTVCAKFPQLKPLFEYMCFAYQRHLLPSSESSRKAD